VTVYELNRETALY